MISRHIRNVFDEAELDRLSTVAEFATVQVEGSRSVERLVEHFNLDVIISVGYRVKSHRGTQFRRWATQRLREYLVKGFVLDDQRFKVQGTDRHFEELLQRIRDIRSSEKVFWRKVLDIYATSEDYDASTWQAPNAALHGLVDMALFPSAKTAKTTAADHSFAAVQAIAVPLPGLVLETSNCAVALRAPVGWRSWLPRDRMDQWLCVAIQDS